MREIIILGAASGWEKAPDGELWAVCTAMPLAIRTGRTVDRGFEIHDSHTHKEAWNDLARQNNIPYYMQDVDPTIPTSVKYPLKEITERFKADYFACSIAYQVALAAYEGVDKISIYGVNMARGSEYAEQKGSVEFWMGVAVGLGIEVVVPNRNSALLAVSGPYGPRKLYGYNLKQEVTWKKKKR